MTSIEKNYSVTQLGALDQWSSHRFAHAAFPQGVPGKAFTKEKLSLSGMEVSFNHVPSGGAIPFYHRHKANEELYVFLSGRGEMQVDDEIIAIEEGSAVRVAPNGKRAWRNTGNTPLVFLVVQARAGTMSTANISDGEVVPGTVEWKKNAA